MVNRSNDAPTRIRALRAALGLNQDKFARALEVSKTAVSAWERGLYEPSPETYVRLGNLASCAEVLWFWEKAGIDRKIILAIAGQLLRENDASPTSEQVASVPQLAVQSECSPETAARILRITFGAVMRLVESGRIKTRRSGRTGPYWLSYDSVIDYANEKREKTK
jgi:transcriptional regulator with XRE-family HTH domain